MAFDDAGRKDPVADILVDVDDFLGASTSIAVDLREHDDGFDLLTFGPGEGLVDEIGLEGWFDNGCHHHDEADVGGENLLSVTGTRTAARKLGLPWQDLMDGASIVPQRDAYPVADGDRTLLVGRFGEESSAQRQLVRDPVDFDVAEFRVHA